MGILQRLKNEWAALSGALRTLKRLKPVAGDKTFVYPKLAAQLAERHGDKVALIGPDDSLTYRQYNDRANQYARWALDQGIGKGDVVGLFMYNCPEYLAIWLGITRIGGVVALLNTNLTGHSLAHCLNIVHAKHVIIDDRLADAYRSSEEFLDRDGCQLWGYGREAEGPWTRLGAVLSTYSTAPLAPEEEVALTTSDPALYIYTSGTTGLPKAANINHYRIQAVMNGFAAVTQSTADDRIYVCMPLYHTAGGVLATGIALTVGGSVVIAEKFSSSTFWDDVVDHDCTMFQYIGELCRYLLNSPPHPKERAHKLRLVDGNGLRPDIWGAFKERFQIPKIIEWYASTEGNAVLFNFDGTPGAVGRIPKWAERKFKTKVVRYDYEAQELVRDANGFCMECAPDEVGEMISEIIDDPNLPSQRFEGYSDKRASRSKMIHDVFRKGDVWFRTGDLMRKDKQGYFFFIDRVGDTFRWKGENVATSEVAEHISIMPGLLEANVYGVTIEGFDGRAGMAALVVDDTFALADFPAHLQALPDYARPVFLRMRSAMQITGTFKQKKIDFVRDGFNPDRIDDDLYMFDRASGQFKPLTHDVFVAVQAGEVRL